MRAAFDASAAVIVASLWADVLPTIAIEALAAGRPVLGTSMGGIPWVVGDAGWIVPPADFRSGLATAARDLADPVTAAALSARARARYASTFTPSVGTRALINLYVDLAAGTPMDTSRSSFEDE
jgi:glycosyltransferase involved in cell wall biosynthesis